MPDPSEHVPVIAVASGKGGVGKTTVALGMFPRLGYLRVDRLLFSCAILCGDPDS